LKILFIGLGSIGQRHLRLIRKIRGNKDDILAYRSRKKNEEVVLDDNTNVLKNRSLSNLYGVKEYENLDTALSKKPDVAFITNPTSLHIPFAIKVAKSGCHLFIEKSLSDSEEGIDELIKIMREKNLIGYVGYQQRFHPGLLKIKTWIEDKRIGNVVSARFENGEYLPNWHPYEDYRESFAAKKSLGGGVLFGMNHELDYIIFLFGKPDRIFCAGGNLSVLDVEYEDTAEVISMFDKQDGTLSVAVHFDYLQNPPQKCGYIIGDKGKVKWNYVKNEATLIDLETGSVLDSWLNPDYERNDMFIAQLNHFFECIRTRKEVSMPIEEARHSIRIALAARKSMETNSIINF